MARIERCDPHTLALKRYRGCATMADQKLEDDMSAPPQFNRQPVKAAIGAFDQVALLGFALGNEEESQDGFRRSLEVMMRVLRCRLRLEHHARDTSSAPCRGGRGASVRRKMTHFKLSVCIATRNRAEFIGETLHSIIQQSTEDVEVVILDGASTDATPTIVAQFSERCPRLRYVRQEKNGGVDHDYDLAVTHAGGDYCWLMSDDDILRPGAIHRVLELIKTGYSLIIVNAELRSLDFSRLIDASRLRFDADCIYQPHEFDRLFEETSAYLSYIGAVVIRREIWISRERAAFFGSYFIHLGVIFQERLPGPSIAIAEPLISVRFGNTQWRPKEFEIRMIRWSLLMGSLAAVSETVRHRLYPVAPWRSLRSLFFYRAKGTYDIGQYRTWVRPRVHTLQDRMCAIIVATFPGVLANLIGLMYCRLPYRDSDVHLLDMKASRFFYRNWFNKASDQAS